MAVAVEFHEQWALHLPTQKHSLACGAGSCVTVARPGVAHLAAESVVI